MCGLIFNNGDYESWKLLYENNIARAGVNKGVFTFTDIFDNQLDGKEIKMGLIQTIMNKEELLKEMESWQCGILHMQAPTSVHSRPHPAKKNDWLLWHNGIIKPSEVKKHGMGIVEWDTEVLVNIIDAIGFKGLSGIDGSFACIAFNVASKRLYMFRNKLSPLFTDGSSLSSTQIADDWISVPANKVFEFKLSTRRWLATQFEFSDNLDTQFKGV